MLELRAAPRAQEALSPHLALSSSTDARAQKFHIPQNQTELAMNPGTEDSSRGLAMPDKSVSWRSDSLWIIHATEHPVSVKNQELPDA